MNRAQNTWAGEIARVVRATSDSVPLGIVRLSLGVLFMFAGIWTLVVPTLWDVWMGQLTRAELPFRELSQWFLPGVEIALGFFLMLGYYTRLSALTVIGVMVVATYTHVVIEDPALFPLQPRAPIVPLVTMAAALYVLWGGGGAWSQDATPP